MPFSHVAYKCCTVNNVVAFCRTGAWSWTGTGLRSCVYQVHGHHQKKDFVSYRKDYIAGICIALVEQDLGVFLI